MIYTKIWRPVKIEELRVRISSKIWRCSHYISWFIQSNNFFFLPDDVDDDTIAAVELQSINESLSRQEEIDRENEHLQIALCKSLDEVVLKAEMESLSSAEERDLITAIELSIRENSKRSSILSGRNGPDNSSDNETLAKIPETLAKIPFSLSVSDFNHHLKKSGNLVLDTILTVTASEEMLNSAEPTEIVYYLQTLDRYLNTLKTFRK